jgi:hypothetical protein
VARRQRLSKTQLADLFGPPTEQRQIDETLFLETCAVPAASETEAATRRRG